MASMATIEPAVRTHDNTARCQAARIARATATTVVAPGGPRVPLSCSPAGTGRRHRQPTRAAPVVASPSNRKELSTLGPWMNPIGRASSCWRSKTDYLRVIEADALLRQRLALFCR